MCAEFSPQDGPVRPLTQPFKDVAMHNIRGAADGGRGLLDRITSLPINCTKAVAKKSAKLVQYIALNIPLPGPTSGYNMAKHLRDLQSTRYRAENGTLFDGFNRVDRRQVDDTLQSGQR